MLRKKDKIVTLIMKICCQDDIGGKLILTIEELQENGLFSRFFVNNMTSLSTNLIRGIAIYAAREMNHCDRLRIIGFTACKLCIDKREDFFRCKSKYSWDGQWYDWCLIEWVNTAQNLSRINTWFYSGGSKILCSCSVIQWPNVNREDDWRIYLQVQCAI